LESSRVAVNINNNNNNDNDNDSYSNSNSNNSNNKSNKNDNNINKNIIFNNDKTFVFFSAFIHFPLLIPQCVITSRMARVHVHCLVQL
jgi:hypothetical protein